MDLFGADEEAEKDDDEIEVSVATDAPAALTHPRASKFSFGHEEVEKQLLELFHSGRMPHGMIFAGPKGIGKATMAYRFARFLFKQGTGSAEDGLFGAPETAKSLDVSSSDPIFSRVASGGHQDLFTVERAYDSGKNKFKATVEVDEIRRITPFLRMTAAEGGWRVVIIDDADTMNRNAQNAILKILEEPPKNTVLLLIAHRPGALIPTIRSRTRLIHFHALSPDMLKTLLEKQEYRLTADEFSTLSGLAQGSFGRAIQIMEMDGLVLAGRVLDLLESWPRHDWTALHKFADSVGNSEDTVELLDDILQSVFARLARIKARGGEITGFGVHRPLAERILAQSPLESLLDTGAALQTHFARLQTANLDRRLGVLTAFSLIS